MTEIDAAVRAKLKADATVLGIVSTRIYFDRLPVNCTLPALTITLIDELIDPDIPSTYEARVQVSCWSDPTEYSGIKSPSAVNTLADAVRSALHEPEVNSGFPEAWTSGSNSYTMLSSTLVGARRVREPDSDYYVVHQDYLMMFRG